MNQAAREDPQAVEELLAAGRELRSAQEGAVAGGDPAALRSAIERRRSARSRLADAAVRRSGETDRDEVEVTLEAASVDEDLGERLRAGTLTRAESGPSGVDALTAMAPAGAAPPDRHRSDPAEQRRLERRLDRAERAVERSRDELARAQDRLADARQAVERAEEAVARHEQARDELRGRLGER